MAKKMCDFYKSPSKCDCGSWQMGERGQSGCTKEHLSEFGQRNFLWRATQLCECGRPTWGVTGVEGCEYRHDPKEDPKQEVRLRLMQWNAERLNCDLSCFPDGASPEARLIDPDRVAFPSSIRVPAKADDESGVKGDSAWELDTVSSYSFPAPEDSSSQPAQTREAVRRATEAVRPQLSPLPPKEEGAESDSGSSEGSATQAPRATEGSSEGSPTSPPSPRPLFQGVTRLRGWSR